MLKLHPLNVFFFLFSALYTFCYAIYFGERIFYVYSSKAGTTFSELFWGDAQKGMLVLSDKESASGFTSKYFAKTLVLEVLANL